MISLIDRWYANLQALEVDGDFFEEIDTGLANIVESGNRCLHCRNRRIFVTTSSLLNRGSLIILTRSSYALVANK
jgi:hypothetical protein